MFTWLNSVVRFLVIVFAIIMWLLRGDVYCIATILAPAAMCNNTDKMIQIIIVNLIRYCAWTFSYIHIQTRVVVCMNSNRVVLT